MIVEREGNVTMSRPATMQEITGILGPAAEDVLADIHRTGATAAEVQEAFARLENNEAVGQEARRGASETVRTVMSIIDTSGSAEED